MPFLGKVPSQIVDTDVDIDGGTIDGATIGSITAGAGTFTNLSATGTITFPDDGISGDDINGGTISNFTSTGIDDNATSTAITISSTQNVGIGTSPSPALGTGLHIRGSGYANLTLQKSASNVGHALEFTDENNAIQYRIGTNFASGGQNLLFAYGSTPAIGMMLDSAGKVGIGTSPSNLLHVDKDTGSTPTVYINNSGADATDGAALKVQASGRGTGIADTSIFSVHNISDELFTVRNDGFVGIGQPSPTHLLHIRKASADNYIRLGSNGANDAGIYFNTATDWTIGTDASNSNAFVLSNSSTVGGLSNVVVTTLGNMGIAGTPQSFGGGVTTLQLKGLSSSQPTRAGALRFISNNGTSCDTAIYSDNGFMSFYTGTSTSQNLNLQIDAYGGLNIKSVAGTQAATFGGSNLVNGITGLPSSAGTPFVVGRDTGTLRSAHFAGHLKFDAGYGIDYGVSGGSGITISSNLLDDYEEGTWSPSIASGSASFYDATYTKVGRLVHLSCLLISITDLSSSTALQITGLPFTSNNSTFVTSCGLSRFINRGNGTVVAYMGGNSNVLYFYALSAGADYLNVRHQDLNNANANYYLNITYQT